MITLAEDVFKDSIENTWNMLYIVTRHKGHMVLDDSKSTELVVRYVIKYPDSVVTKRFCFVNRVTTLV